MHRYAAPPGPREGSPPRKSNSIEVLRESSDYKDLAARLRKELSFREKQLGSLRVALNDGSEEIVHDLHRDLSELAGLPSNSPPQAALAHLKNQLLSLREQRDAQIRRARSVQERLAEVEQLGVYRGASDTKQPIESIALRESIIAEARLLRDDLDKCRDTLAVETQTRRRLEEEISRLREENSALLSHSAGLEATRAYLKKQIEEVRTRPATVTSANVECQTISVWVEISEKIKAEQSVSRKAAMEFSDQLSLHVTAQKATQEAKRVFENELVILRRQLEGSVRDLEICNLTHKEEVQKVRNQYTAEKQAIIDQTENKVSVMKIQLTQFYEDKLAEALQARETALEQVVAKRDRTMEKHWEAENRKLLNRIKEMESELEKSRNSVVELRRERDEERGNLEISRKSLQAEKNERLQFEQLVREELRLLGEQTISERKETSKKLQDTEEQLANARDKLQTIHVNQNLEISNDQLWAQRLQDLEDELNQLRVEGDQRALSSEDHLKDERNLNDRKSKEIEQLKKQIYSAEEDHRNIIKGFETERLTWESEGNSLMEIKSAADEALKLDLGRLVQDLEISRSCTDSAKNQIASLTLKISSMEAALKRKDFELELKGESLSEAQRQLLEISTSLADAQAGIDRIEGGENEKDILIAELNSLLMKLTETDIRAVKAENDLEIAKQELTIERQKFDNLQADFTKVELDLEISSSFSQELKNRHFVEIEDLVLKVKDRDDNLLRSDLEISSLKSELSGVREELKRSEVRLDDKMHSEFLQAADGDASPSVRGKSFGAIARDAREEVRKLLDVVAKAGSEYGSSSTSAPPSRSGQNVKSFYIATPPGLATPTGDGSPKPGSTFDDLEISSLKAKITSLTEAKQKVEQQRRELQLGARELCDKVAAVWDKYHAVQAELEGERKKNTRLQEKINSLKRIAPLRG